MSRASESAARGEVWRNVEPMARKGFADYPRFGLKGIRRLEQASLAFGSAADAVPAAEALASGLISARPAATSSRLTVTASALYPERKYLTARSRAKR